MVGKHVESVGKCGERVGVGRGWRRVGRSEETARNNGLGIEQWSRTDGLSQSDVLLTVTRILVLFN